MSWNYRRLAPCRSQNHSVKPGSYFEPVPYDSWYGKYTDADNIVRKVKLCEDKAASQQMLNELVRKAELGKAGLVDPFAAQRKRPLPEHVADFRQHLEAKGNSGQHVALTVARCETVFSACGFKLLTQLDADKASHWLKQRRDEGLGIATSNHHLVAVKGFGNWLVKSRWMERNPFAHLSRLNSKVDVQVERRALESEELSRLIEATERSKKTFRGPAEPDRSALYTLAAMTGLRANELGSLTPASFDFEAVPPTVRIEAKKKKVGRGAAIPLHPFVADKLTHWLTSRGESITETL